MNAIVRKVINYLEFFGIFAINQSWEYSYHSENFVILGFCKGNVCNYTWNFNFELYHVEFNVYKIMAAEILFVN